MQRLFSNVVGSPKYVLQTPPGSLPVYGSDVNYMNNGKNYIH